MNFERYTERSRGFVQSAQSRAVAAGHQQFTPEHLLKELLDDRDGLAANLIRAAGGRPEEALESVEAALAALPRVEGDGAGHLYIAPETAQLFEQAEKVAEQAGDRFVTAEVLRILTESEGPTRILYRPRKVFLLCQCNPRFEFSIRLGLYMLPCRP